MQQILRLPLIVRIGIGGILGTLALWCIISSIIGSLVASPNSAQQLVEGQSQVQVNAISEAQEEANVQAGNMDPKFTPGPIQKLQPCPEPKTLPDIGELGKVNRVDSLSLYSYQREGGTGTLFIQVKGYGGEWRVFFAILELSPNGDLLLGLRRSLSLQTFQEWITANIHSMDDLRNYMKAIGQTRDQAKIEEQFNCTVQK